jgi:hypothetical protein
MTGPELRSLICPNCGAPVNVRAVGITLTVVCGNCGSSLDAADPDLAILHQSLAATSRARIPLGTRGRLGGIEWEAIGYMERSGGGSWDETLLFNPWVGYRFLVHAEGEWRSGTPMDAVPEEAGNNVMLGGDRFRAEDGYDATVDFVVGEFYWRVAVGETVSVVDFDGPGDAMLSREANGAEVAWTRLDKHGDGVVERAFGLEPPEMPASRHHGSREAPLAKTLIALIATVIMLFISVIGPGEQQVINTDLMPVPDGPVLTETIGVVSLQRRRSIVAVTTRADLDNAWVDLDVALVDRKTQERFEAYTVVERYSGTDSDGRWSEGDANRTIHFASLPRGSYDVIVEASAHKWPARGYFEPPPEFLAPPTPVNITVSRDASISGNLWLALLLIWLLPGWQWLVYFNTEDD